MKLAWDDIAVLIIVLVGAALIYDWYQARKTSSTPMITSEAETQKAVSPPQTVDEYINAKYPDAL